MIYFVIFEKKTNFLFFSFFKKYPLLLKELTKCTDPSHPDYKLLVKAGSHMENILQNLNEGKRRQENLLKVLEFKTRLGKKESSVSY
jgi:hypothetical protein